MLSGATKTNGSGLLQLPPGVGLRIAPVNGGGVITWPVKVRLGGEDDALAIMDTGVNPYPKALLQKQGKKLLEGLVTSGLANSQTYVWQVAEDFEDLQAMRPGERYWVDINGMVAVVP